MPFHFEEGEDMLNPETNALRGVGYLAEMLDRMDGEVGLALAAYNGGPSVADRTWESWPAETQRYYRWGTGIYAEISAGSETSPTLDEWLAAGGESLCRQAAGEVGMP
jgi:soluble lytic murein transglycosylase-like protein